MSDNTKFTTEAEWVYKGFKCRCVACSMGHRNGYVKIPENHPFYKLRYNEKAPENLCSVINEDTEMGKRGSIDIFLHALRCGDSEDPNPDFGFLFNVHGGVTHTGYLGDDKDNWWIGFDCNHCDDGKDFSIMDDQWKETWEKYPSISGYGKACTKEYVLQECKHLVDQIIELEKLYEKNNA